MLAAGGEEVGVFLIDDGFALMAGGSGEDWISPVHHGNTGSFAAEEWLFYPVLDAL